MMNYKVLLIPILLGGFQGLFAADGGKGNNGAAKPAFPSLTYKPKKDKPIDIEQIGFDWTEPKIGKRPGAKGMKADAPKQKTECKLPTPTGAGTAACQPLSHAQRINDALPP